MPTTAPTLGPLPVEFFPCFWLVETANPAASDPDWYPDFPSDLTVVAECGAPAAGFADGSFACTAGHDATSARGSA